MHIEEKWQQLYAYIQQLKEAKPWTLVAEHQFFAIEKRDQSGYYFCAILGSDEAEYGFTAYEGSEGYRLLKKIQQYEDTLDLHLLQRGFTVSYVNRDELDKVDYEKLKSLSLSYRGKNQWPQLRQLVPGMYPWYVDEAQLDEWTYLLTETLQLLQEWTTVPTTATTIVARQQTAEGKRITTEFVPFLMAQQEEGTLWIEEAQLETLRNSAKRLKAVTEYDVFLSPMAVRQKRGEQPYFPSVALIADQRERRVFAYQMFEGELKAADIQQHFMATFRTINRLPKEVRVESMIAEQALKPLAKALQFTLTNVQNLPVIQPVREEMLLTLQAQRSE